MFTQMRTVLLTQRMQATGRRYRGEPAPPMIGHRDVLEYAILRGAAGAGLSDSIGSLSPGKQADVVVVRAEDVNNLPFNNAIGTIVQGTDARNVDTVFVGGRVRKWSGQLIGQDIARVRALAYESRDYLARKAGFVVDPVRRLPPQQIQDPYLRDYFASRQAIDGS